MKTFAKWLELKEKLQNETMAETPGPRQPAAGPEDNAKTTSVKFTVKQPTQSFTNDVKGFTELWNDMKTKHYVPHRDRPLFTKAMITRVLNDNGANFYNMSWNDDNTLVVRYESGTPSKLGEGLKKLALANQWKYGETKAKNFFILHLPGSRFVLDFIEVPKTVQK